MVNCVTCKKVTGDFSEGKCAECWFWDMVLQELRENCPPDDCSAEDWSDFINSATDRIVEAIISTGEDPDSIEEQNIYHALLDAWTDRLHLS